MFSKILTALCSRKILFWSLLTAVVIAIVVSATIDNNRQQAWNSDLSKIVSLLDNRADNSAIAAIESAKFIWGEKPQLNFLQARAYRHLDKQEDFYPLMEKAQAGGWNIKQIEHEKHLMEIQLSESPMPKSVLDQVLLSDLAPFAENADALFKAYSLQWNKDGIDGIVNNWRTSDPVDKHCLPYYRGLIGLVNASGEEAVEFFNQSISANKDFVPAWLGRGEANLLVRKNQESVVSYAEAARLDPGNRSALTGLAYACIASIKLPEAEKALLELNADKDTDTQLAKKLARVYVEMEKEDKALEILKRYHEAWPLDIEVNAMLASIYQLSGDDKQADIHGALAAKYQQKRDLIGGLFDDAMLDRNNVPVRLELGSSLLDYVSREDGVKFLKQALFLDPNQLDALNLLQQYYTKVGNKFEAKMYQVRISAAK